MGANLLQLMREVAKMQDKNTKLIPIAYDYLYAGMRVLDDIYNYNGKIVLIRKDDILDEIKLKKLKNFNSERRNIKVKINTYNSLRENKAVSQALQLEKLENDTGYGEVKQSVNSFLVETKYSNKVDETETNNLQKNIVEILNSSDISKIFECINSPYPVDEYLQHHCTNVSLINGIIAQWLKLDVKQAKELILTGMLHDIGKTKVNQDILNAPRKLTSEEFEHIKQHSQFTYELLNSNEAFSENVKLGALYHHERIDGTGYPNRLKGDEIPLYAKITSISDVYDALVSRRCYKNEQSALSVLNMMSKGEVGTFDSFLLSVFLQNMPNKFLNKNVLMNDGTIAKIRFILLNDIEHPVLDIDGEIKQANSEWNCARILTDEN